MKKPLLGQKVAVLVANGFCEKDLTLTQRAMVSAGATLRIVSMDHGLVNSWNGDGWGLNFAADQVLSKALAADYDMLIVPGGRRSIEKLELTAHTRRFIGGFIDTAKPVAIYEDALELLLFSERVDGLTVSGPGSFRERSEKMGASWSEQNFSVSNRVITGLSNEETCEDYAHAVSEFFIAQVTEEENSQKTEEKLPEAVAA